MDAPLTTHQWRSEHGRMSRSEGLKLVRHYDSKTPSTLPFYCQFLGISVEDFYRLIDLFRDERFGKRQKGKWSVEGILSGQTTILPQ